MIDWTACRPHYLDHLAPTWREVGGTVHVPARMAAHARRRGVEALAFGGEEEPRFTADTVAVASRGDYFRAARRGCGVIYTAHGNGQSFVEAEHPGYAGGPGLDKVVCFLAVNEHNAATWRRSYPSVPVELIGCPRLDRLADRRPSDRAIPRVCVSFHWDARGTGNRIRETWTAWPFYRRAVERMAKRHHRGDSIELVCHGHPRIARRLRPWVEALGLRWIADIEEVLDTCDLYANDCSSTLYEAATVMPVVVLNTPDYRRDREHGLRFWEFADVGIQVDRPDDLEAAIVRTLTDDPQAERRAEIVPQVFPFFGGAAQRAADVIRRFACS